MYRFTFFFSKLKFHQLALSFFSTQRRFSFYFTKLLLLLDFLYHRPLSFTAESNLISIQSSNLNHISSFIQLVVCESTWIYQYWSWVQAKLQQHCHHHPTVALLSPNNFSIYSSRTGNIGVVYKLYITAAVIVQPDFNYCNWTTFPGNTWVICSAVSQWRKVLKTFILFYFRTQENSKFNLTFFRICNLCLKLDFFHWVRCQFNLK